MPRRFTKLKQLLALIGYAAYGQDTITMGRKKWGVSPFIR
jgi:hypothetical protein